MTSFESTFSETALSWNQALRQIFEPFKESFAAIAETAQQLDRLERSGWLPHYTTPWQKLPSESNPNEDDTFLEGFYSQHWSEVQEAFEGRLEMLEVDDESAAVFKDCLRAHGAGLFRCVPRTLFPDLERIARREFKIRVGDGISRQTRLKEISGGMEPREGSVPGMASFTLYRKLNNHMFEEIKTAEALARAAANPVPNRHASVHGLLLYNSRRHSFNALVATEFAYSCMAAWKRRKESSAE